MANKSKRKQKKHLTKAEEEAQDAEIRKALSEPWIQHRSRLMMMGLLGLGIALFMIWQLYPTEGLGRSIMWGLASATAVWVVFLLSFGFNKMVRR